jgi:hypothetical protein
MSDRKSVTNSSAQRANAGRTKKHHFPTNQNTLKQGDIVAPHHPAKKYPNDLKKPPLFQNPGGH